MFARYSASDSEDHYTRISRMFIYFSHHISRRRLTDIFETFLHGMAVAAIEVLL